MVVLIELGACLRCRRIRGGLAGQWWRRAVRLDRVGGGTVTRGWCVRPAGWLELERCGEPGWPVAAAFEWFGWLGGYLG